MINQTTRTRVSRLARRASFDPDVIHGILDEALFCTISYTDGDQPFLIPTGYVRVGEQIYVHGSVGSHYLRQLADGRRPVCVAATLIDGLVLARSAFHHSVNYRSVILFATARLVTEKAEMLMSLEAFTNKMIPGRWKDVRQPTDSELKKTLVIAFSVDEASAKVRTGPPVDDEEDLDLSVWAGVLPIITTHGIPQRDQQLPPSIDLPAYLRDLAGKPRTIFQ